MLDVPACEHTIINYEHKTTFITCKVVATPQEANSNMISLHKLSMHACMHAPLLLPLFARIWQRFENEKQIMTNVGMS